MSNMQICKIPGSKYYQKQLKRKPVNVLKFVYVSEFRDEHEAPVLTAESSK